MQCIRLIFWYSIFGLAIADDISVTCGSVIKLLNLREGVRLHSHDVKYGSGSGQQSVTGMTEADDVNSHWQVLAPMKKHCHRGDPIKCGEQIRLKHLTTGCYLHSHLFTAPLSRGNQEISCFGKNDEGDTGDHWILSCETGEWLRGEPVSLKHVDTGKYLATSGEQYGRPISGQKEVVGISSITKAALWKTAEGVYMVHSDNDNYGGEVLTADGDSVKKMCFEDADDKVTICQEESSTKAPKKPKRTTTHSQQRYQEPQHVYTTTYGDTSRTRHFSSNSWIRMLQSIVMRWWSWDYIFLFMIALVQLRVLQSDYANVITLFVVMAIMLWILRSINVEILW